jgi:hypothetical protein
MWKEPRDGRRGQRANKNTRSVWVREQHVGAKAEHELIEERIP